MGYIPCGKPSLPEDAEQRYHETSYLPMLTQYGCGAQMSSQKKFIDGGALNNLQKPLVPEFGAIALRISRGI